MEPVPIGPGPISVSAFFAANVTVGANFGAKKCFIRGCCTQVDCLLCRTSRACAPFVWPSGCHRRHLIFSRRCRQKKEREHEREGRQIFQATAGKGTCHKVLSPATHSCAADVVLCEVRAHVLVGGHGMRGQRGKRHPIRMSAAHEVGWMLDKGRVSPLSPLVRYHAIFVTQISI